MRARQASPLRNRAFLDVGDGLARTGFVNGNELKMKHAKRGLGYDENV